MKYEHEEWVKDHGFFQHYHYQLRFIMVIQLSKLIANKKRSHKRNLYYLCEALEAADFNEDFLKDLRRDQPKRFIEPLTTGQSIIEMVAKIKEALDQNLFLIMQVVEARDQIYAHNDPNSNMKVPSIGDLETLIQLCNGVFNRFTGVLYKSHTDFAQTAGWDIDFVLREMTARRKSKIDART